MNSGKNKKKIPQTNVRIQGNKIRMTVDIGATINVTDRGTFNQMSDIMLQPTKVKAYPYNGLMPVKFLGKFEAEIGTTPRYAAATCVIQNSINSAGGCLLSSQTAEELGLVTFNLNKLTERKSRTRTIKGKGDY